MNPEKKNIEPEKTNLIQSIIGIISILLSCHYYLSFKWINGFLNLYDIDSLAVIALEDVTFPFGSLNASVIILTSLGFLWIYGWKLASTQADYDNSGRILANNWKEFVQNFKEFWSKLSLAVKFSISLGIVGLIVGYIFLFKPNLNFPNQLLEWFYILIFIAIPLVYILSSKKRNLIMGLYILCMFAWANLFVKVSLDNIAKPRNEKNRKITEMSFIYDGKPIQTSDTLNFIYHGYKYLIMATPDSILQLYPTDKIGLIKYKEKIVE